MIVRSPVAMHVGFIAANRQLSRIADGRLCGAKQAAGCGRGIRRPREVYERAPRGMRRPELDRSFAALILFLRQVTVVMHADRQREIERALDLAQEFTCEPIIAGAPKQQRSPSGCASATCRSCCRSTFPKRTTAAAPEADSGIITYLARACSSTKDGAKLAARGRFAFQSGGIYQHG